MTDPVESTPAQTSAKTVTACLIIIGNEVLSGRTRDANLPYLATRLNERGIRLREARIVPDVEGEIADAVNACRARYDYVFTTGGIGPTHDDITAASIAVAFGLPLEENVDAVTRLEAHYPPGELNPARRRMARMPEGAILIDNPVSTAPGFQIGNVLVMAGVPQILQAMVDGVLPRLAGGAPVLSRSVTCDLPESILAPGLEEIQARYPAIDIGSYPRFGRGRFDLNIVLRGTDDASLDKAAGEVATLIGGLGGTVDSTG